MIPALPFCTLMRETCTNFVVTVHCSMLAEDAIKSAISDYYTKNPKARTTDLSGTGASMPDIDQPTAGTPAASL